MSEKINDEDLAKEAIANSPEVTHTALDESEVAPSKAAKRADIEAFEYEPDHRNGRLLKLMLEQWGKNKLDQAQIEAAEEVGAEGFGALKAAPIPSAIKLTVTFLLLLGSIVPLAFDLKGAFKEEHKEEHKEEVKI